MCDLITDLPDGMREWLGPAWGQLTSYQIQQMAYWWRDIDHRYPSPCAEYDDTRSAALTAAVQVILGETSLDDLATAHREQPEENSLVALRQAILMDEDADLDELESRSGVPADVIGDWLNGMLPS